jgi:hypothetical protein
MPQQVSLTDHAAAADGGPATALAALSPASIWAQARREFAIDRIEQLPLRARLLDLLEHLDRGHLMAIAAAATPSIGLDGFPDVTLLAGVLFTYGYVEIAGRHRDNPRIVYFRLSPAGRGKLREGRHWWNGLPPWRRLVVRLFG